MEVTRRDAGSANSRRRQIVTVIGSGVTSDPHCDDIGRLIAALGCDLLTGGGRGVMEAVSRAFYETMPRRGLVIGIIPGHVRPMEALEHRESVPVLFKPQAGYPNEWVEIAIYTHLPDSGDDGTLRSSRNHINVLTANAIVALPGREGTASELWLAVKYGIPAIAIGDHQEPVPATVPVANTIADVEAFLREHLRFD